MHRASRLLGYCAWLLCACDSRSGPSGRSGSSAHATATAIAPLPNGGQRYVPLLPVAPSTSANSTTTSPSSASVAAPSSAAPAAAPSSSAPDPAPSVLLGRAACDACLAAVEARRFLTPRGFSHFLAGCDDDALRERCLGAARRALPGEARSLITEHDCTETHALLELAQRTGTSSPALRAVVAKCQPPK